MTNRRYQTQLNAALERKNASERKIESTKRYNRASEDPISAAKALRVRKGIAETEDYMDNLSTAKQIYNAADSAVLNVVDILDTICEQITYAVNGTQSVNEVEIISNDIFTHAEEIASTMNVDSADRLIFGGVSNGAKAFTIETAADGKKYVTYNGVAVNNFQKPEDFPDSEVSYTDIGIGMYIDQATGRVAPQSALPVTINGAEVMGCGVDEQGYSKNIIQIALDAAQALKDGNKEEAMGYVDRLRNAQTSTSIAHADIGNKQKFIEYNETRLTSNLETLYEKQNDLEGTDLAKETTNWKTLESIYNVSLQLATSVIPMSIFEFMR